MSYDAEGAVGAGIFAGVVVTLILYVFLALFPRVKINLLHFLGTVFQVGRAWQVYPLGLLAFLVISAILGLIHASLYEAFGIDTNMVSWGLIFGIAQWLIDGALMGPASRLHPGVKTGLADDLGYFLVNERTAAAMAFLVVHLLFGVFVATFYDALR